MSYVYFLKLDVDAMHLSRLVDFMLVVLLVSSLLLAGMTIAEEPPVENKVDASFDIEFVTGTNLNVHTTMDAYKLTTDKTYNAEEIKSASEQEIGAFRFKLYQMLKEQLDGVFENADILNFTMPTFDGNRFNDDFNIMLTSSFFGINESVNSNDFINGVLDMSAIVNYTFNLKADPGWNNTYTFILPSSIGYKRTTGSVNGDRIKWDVRNGDGKHPSRLAELSIKLNNPTTPKLDKEDIQLRFELNNTGGKQTSLTGNILTYSIDIRNYSILPEFITNLDILPSDGVRLLVDNGFISWEEFYEEKIKNIEKNIVSEIENSSFNQTLDTVFSWDANTTTDCLIPYEITNMDDNPPVRSMITDNDVKLKICNISSRALFGLVNAGAQANISAGDVNFGGNLNKIGYQFDGMLYLPDHIFLDGKNKYIWNQTIPISGQFESNAAPKYSDEKIDTTVEIETENTDLNLLSFFTGGSEMTFGLFLQEVQNYSVVTIPNEFNLPEKVSLHYLNSDAFRVCVEEKVFDKNEISSFLNDEKQIFEIRLADILKVPKIDGSADRDNFDKSLKWDGDIGNMDGFTPVEIASHAYSSYSIPFDLSFLPPKFKVFNQSFNFTGVQNQNVTYKLIFPHGITIIASDSLGKIEGVKETDDGREYIEINFDPKEFDLADNVSIKIIPSLLFIVGLFMPCIASFIITVILVAVIYAIRRRRRRGRPENRDETFNGYNGQNYYMPPPPPSKR